MALDPDREIYPSAPLNLVAFELRFPPVPTFDTDSGRQELYAALREKLPILGPPPVLIELDASGPRQRLGTRVLDRQRLCTVTVMSNAVTVETSAYERYERFAELIQFALERISQVDQVPAVLRIGLRYIDEITVPGVTTIDNWREYITDDLLTAAAFHGYETTAYRGQLRLQVEDDHEVNVSFGLVDSPVVDPAGPLRIAHSPRGQYFLLDIDSAWIPPQDEYAEVSPTQVIATCERLHDPIRTVFERAIKPKLRDDVLRVKEPDVSDAND